MRAALFALTLAACGGQPSIPVIAAESAVAATDFRNAEGQLICPVMGDVIPSKAEAVGSTEYEGKTYWFCCDSCQYMFADAPDKYADGVYVAHLEAEHGGRFGGCPH
jgi:YHS domain-containing protein